MPICWLCYAGTPQIRALQMGLTIIFPRAAPVSHCLHLCKIPATATCFISVLLKQACLETPRPIKGRTCQQHKQPASSSKESPGLGIICVDCPGTEHLFLETGATSVVQQPSQVMLPGLLPVCSAACFYAKPQLLPK